ncbi:MAG TPA: TIGR02996 domain-containing protein [Gemmataceae bacterium]|nr:TIGR02996 domain-containing protein [Gemmataceae bacterium]
MTLERHLLKDIEDHPDSDGPRMLYADWLAHHGQEARAEFISVQCSLATLPRDETCAADLVARERQLLELYRDEWLRPVRLCLDVGPSEAITFRFHRGLVEEAHGLTAARLLSRAEALFELAPTLRRVRLSPATAGDLPALSASPFAGRLLSLGLDRNGLEDDAAAALADAAGLSRLLDLDLSHNRITDAGADVLLASPHRRGLRRLGLLGNPCAPRADRLRDLAGRSPRPLIVY